MKDKILAQIQNINEALAWIRQHKPEHYNTQFINLVDERRKLRRLAAALSDNPAIAAFGESQMGKSHLMNCLLQKDGKPFMLEADGRRYKYIDEINPIGNGNEATGVVTRFSSFVRDPEAYSPQYPVLARLHSVKDLLLILSDSFFTDFADYETDSESDIIKHCDDLQTHYANSSAVSGQTVLSSDDLLDMGEYFNKYVNNGRIFLRTNFFTKIALFIDRIPTTDYVSVFSILWKKDTLFTQLFKKCMSVLERLHFAERVYLPIDAVLHRDINENTVMSVDCLNKLFVSDTAVKTEAYLRAQGQMQSLGEFTKSEVCAVCAEVMFYIPEEFYSSLGHYQGMNTPYMSEAAAHLPSDEVKMEILKDNDLLDFPGAKSRQAFQFEKLYSPEKDEESRIETLMNCFLRGKVAYLFNKYNHDLRINSLLYCHDSSSTNVNYLSKLVESWVNTYVGNTPEARAKTLQSTGNISPLFCISTKFNMHLMSLNARPTDSVEAMRQRWIGRFDRALFGSVLQRMQVKWLDDWTASGVHFKNTYVLRDFKYSQELYTQTDGVESEWNTAAGFTPEYYKQMQQTFIEDPDVKDFFENPLLAWQVATSLGNDGALYIIQRLSKVAEQMNAARQILFEKLLSATKDKVYRLLKDYHVSDDIDELLNENVHKAQCIMRELDFACNADNYFFGHLIQALQISEPECLKEVHRIINSGELNVVNDFKNYEIIRSRCADFVGCRSTEDKWDLLLQRYGFRTKDEAQHYLEQRGVKPELLFAGEQQRRLNSVVIASRVFDLWKQRLRDVDILSRFTDSDDIFDPIVLSDLVDDVIATAESLGLPDALHTAIAEYVDVLDPAKANESLVADLMASELSDFVVNFGFDRLTAEDIAKAKAIAENRHLPTFNFIERERKSEYDEDELAAIFDNLNSGETSITPAFEDNYSSWVEYMFVSFIAHLNIPDYDVEANKQLSDLLQRIA